MVKHQLSSEKKARIRRIFSTKRAYAIGEAATLLGFDERDLRSEVERGDITATAETRQHLPWKEVAYLALRTWPLKTIFDALGTDASSLLPAGLQPAAFSVLLPTYQVRMLEVLALRERLDAGTYLQGQLLDLASGADHVLLEEQIPGFLEALFFPFGGER